MTARQPTASSPNRGVPVCFSSIIGYLPPIFSRERLSTARHTGVTDPSCKGKRSTEDNRRALAEAQEDKKHSSASADSESALCRDVSEHTQSKSPIGLGGKLRMMIRKALPSRESVSIKIADHLQSTDGTKALHSMRQASALREASYRALRTQVLPSLPMQNGSSGSATQGAVPCSMLLPRNSHQKSGVRDGHPRETALHISSRRVCSVSSRTLVLSTYNLRPMDPSKAYQDGLRDPEVSSLSSNHLFQLPRSRPRKSRMC